MRKKLLPSIQALITSSPTHEMAIIENTIFSKMVRRMLGLSLHAWENVTLISLGVAAIAAVFVGISTYAVINLQKVEAEDAKNDLEKYKLDAGQKIAEAVARAAEANLELERLKAPRTLTAEQQLRITEKVKIFHGTTFEVITYPGEPEPVAFSSIIAGILVRAGWTLNPNNSHGSLLGLASGVVVVVGKQAGAKAEQSGTVLLESITSEGVDARLGSASLQINPTSIAIQLQVGKKP